MELELPLLVQLFLLFAAAKLAGELLERLGQPAVIGELGVGIALGAGMLGVVEVAHEAFLPELAELCVVFLLFRVGLETRLSDIRAVGGRAATVAVAGVVVPFALGYGFYALTGYDSIHSLFLGTALVATSVGVTARVLADLKLLGERESRIILGAAVIDDILGLICLSIVTGMASTGTVDVGSIATTIALSVAFLVVFGVLGSALMARSGHLLERPRIANAPFAFAVAVCLGIAALAQVIGLAAIVGAFVAGMVMAESPAHFELEHKFEPVGELLVPFFFVVTGAAVDPAQFAGGGILLVVAAVVALAIVGKLVGCGLAARSLGWKSAAIVGVGMVPRGEVGIIVANEGMKAGAIDERTFAVIIAMSILTTLVVPPVLKPLFVDRIARRRIAEEAPGAVDETAAPAPVEAPLPA